MEAVLLEHDAIADSACVGINLSVYLPLQIPTTTNTRSDNEEWPRGYVVLKDTHKGKVTEEDIHKFMFDKVAKHKRLVGGIVFIDEVPKLASGKIVRKLLKEWAKRDAFTMKGPVRARL